MNKNQIEKPFIYRNELTRLVLILNEKFDIRNEYLKCKHQQQDFIMYMNNLIQTWAETGLNYTIKRQLTESTYNYIDLKNGFYY
jgi:hypothetical protein